MVLFFGQGSRFSEEANGCFTILLSASDDENETECVDVII